MDIQNHIQKLILENKHKGLVTKDISDGYHTFRDLYYHRMILFSVICNMNKERSWKSRLHHDGTMFGDNAFIVGVDTPEGSFTYHYNLEFWDHFQVKELEYAPEWDGHKPDDVTRLISLLNE